MTTVPEEAVKAAAMAHTPQFANMDPTIQKYALEQMRAALTAAINHLPQGVGVNIDEIVQPLEDIHAPGGLCRWTDVATAIGEVRRALRSLEPSATRELALEEAVRKHLKWFERFICDQDELNSSTPRKVAQNAQDAAAELRAALSSPDHADAGKVEGGGWLPMTHPSLPKKGRFLAVATGEIERIAWNDPAAVVTVKAFDGPFVCYVHEDGAGFTDEFGEVYRADGIVIDAEDLTAADNVLRLTYWQPMPAIPSAPASEGAE
ncbi:hypothetical protein [Brucella anthropi]|uniref:hypothetical protein n=1 Tax=Brucella anthropi TaxID=529 RepID=UPI00320A36CC